MTQLKIICKEAGIKLPYICYVSAYVEDKFQNKARESGMDFYMAKPFNFDQLEVILKKLKLI